MSETFHGVKIPAPSTLAKYGLDLADWKRLAKEAGYACEICHQIPPNRILVIDHYHVAGWKKMPPEERKKYVRGLVCITDNHFVLTRYLTPEKAEAAAAYLRKGDPRWST